MALEVLGRLCAIASLGGDVALFGGVGDTERVNLGFFGQKYFMGI